jgi:hypothetical protein
VAGGSTDTSWTESAGSDSQFDYYIVHRGTLYGLTFYQGGKRINPQQVLAVLQDPALEQEYNKKLEEYRSKASRARAVAITVIVFQVVGVATMFSALAFVGYDEDDDSEPNRTPAYALLGGGAALCVTGAIIWGAAPPRAAPQFHYELRRNMFVDTSLVERLAYSLLRYNRRVASSCGYTGPVEIPMPAHFKALAPRAAPQPSATQPPRNPPPRNPPPPAPPPPPQEPPPVPSPPELDPSREIDSLPTEE